MGRVLAVALLASLLAAAAHAQVGKDTKHTHKSKAVQRVRVLYVNVPVTIR